MSESPAGEPARRKQVLRVALGTFARFGYRKTSMEDVARAAEISRPGLYFLFSSKENLFRAAVIDALDDDLAAAASVLADTGRPLRERLIEALDLWAGRYVGPLAGEVTVLVDANPGLLGAVVTEYPRRFVELLTSALADAGAGGVAEDLARTLHSTAAGIKHEVATRAEFVARMTVGVDLMLPALVRTPG
ncbi:TetR/AcrR family transcriptional regulator [Cryptosporangium arvum]|uniref:Transcriptional regulator n=1 Tax=Cryptosporangium arvum DSM 44712 TaxID=927661 RepID=A0A010YR34_9ACTN|nr:TetR/AcrR family transcriptional regulator [Cryptosporangium arvum]EXG82655.1 transcriptional regulator [Cryptosporangium arvum DSM 44712]